MSIIRAGRTVESGTLAELRHLTRTSIAAETARSATGLADLPGVHDLDVDDGRARFDVDTAHLDAAVRHLTGFGPAQPHQPTADVGGAVPAALRRRARRAARRRGVAGARCRSAAMSTLTGTTTMVRFILRRDRIRIPVWIVAVVGLAVLTASSVQNLYPYLGRPAGGRRPSSRATPRRSRSTVPLTQSAPSAGGWPTSSARSPTSSSR